MIIDSPIISGSYLSTGSLSQTGNVSITGSLTVTGGISGSFSGSGADLFGIPASGITGLNLSQISSGSVSASISPNQGLLINTRVSASNFTGSFTGSLTGIATSASYASFALTSSYSLGGSGFPFSGSAVITGSLIVSGSGLTITGSVAISTLTTGSGVRYVIADQNGLLSAQTASAAIFTTQQVVSTAGQTTFPITNGYATGYVTVFVNGTKLSADEYVDTSGTNIVFLTGSNSGDNVEFQKYLPAAGVSNNTLRSINYFTATTGQTNFSVNYTPGLIDIFYNGAKLDNTEYTAANGTSITLATASAAGDRLEVDVYSYQVGAFSGIGGTGAANQLAYFNTSNSITGSNAFTVSGSAIIITGSLIVSGSGTLINIGPAVFSGSVTSTAGFSGSFSGNADSASLAQNSLLLQGTGSIGFATTASLLAVSSSQQQISASLLNVVANYATTGSNSFRANQSITGSLVVSSTITAQTLVVQTVTSSIVYSSGSNVFGNQLANTQTFTGSVNITGSLTVNTTGTEFQVNNTGVVMGNLLTDSHSVTGSLRVTGSLNVNISGSSTQALAVKISGSAYNGANVWFQDASATDGISFGGNGVNSYKTINTYGGALYLNNISQNGVNLFGNVGINTTSSLFPLHIITPYSKTTGSIGQVAQMFISTNESSAAAPFGLRFQVFGASTLANRYATMQTTDYSSADGGNIVMQPGGGNIGIGTTSPSTLTHIHTARSSGANVDIMTLSDNVTGIQTSGFGVRILATSNNGQAKSAIAFEADGGTNNDTAIAFYTQTSAAALSQRLIIDKNGTVRVNTSISSTNYKFGVSGSAYINGTNNKGVFITDGASYASIVGLNSAISAYNSIELRASGVDGQLYLTSGGNVGFFTTSPAGSVASNLVHINGASAVLRVGPNYFASNGSTDRDYLEIIPGGANTIITAPNETFSLINTGGGAGSWAIDIIAGSGGVRLTNGATSWSAISSDRRKKKNFETSQGLAEVLQIEPVKYHFEWDDDSIPKRMGFIAQNIQPLIPEMVSATKEKAEDGSPYLTLTPDYILPVLVKAIQEQNVLIQELQEKLQRNNIN